MSAKPTGADDQTETVTLEYGDEFRHKSTGDVFAVHDVRDDDNKVLWTNGGFEWQSELEAAIRGDRSFYEPHNCNNSWD